MISKRFLIMSILTIFCFSFVLADGPIVIPQIKNTIQKARIGNSDFRNVVRANASEDFVKSVLGSNYRLVSKKVWGNGSVTLKCQYFFKNLPVIGSNVNVNLFANKPVNVRGFQFKIDSDLNVKPSIKLQVAVSKAKSYFKAELKVEDAKLAIFSTDKKDYLVWSFSLNNNKGTKWHFIIDAHEGNIVASYNLIQIFTLRGEGKTNLVSDGEFNGPKVSFTYTNDGSYNRLVSEMYGTGIRTYSHNNGSSTSDGDEDTSATVDTWEDQVAATAHYYTENAIKFYKEVFDRNGIDGNNFTMRSIVHIPDGDGNPGYDNAYWDGSKMSYGDGSWNGSEGYFSPLCVADVVCHEMTHGYTSNTADLAYFMESGAMNEAMSDIIGTSYEFWLKQNNPGLVCDWVRVGEECTPEGSKLGRDALRYMDDPTKAKQPKEYKGEYWYSGWNDNGGVHTNCAVGNRAFYLMAVGGEQNGIQVEGIGVLLAAKVFFITDGKYLSSYASYSDWPQACIDAIDNDITADDIANYGVAGVTKESMKTTISNAWEAVKVSSKSTFMVNNIRQSEQYIKEKESVKEQIYLEAGQKYKFSIKFSGKDADLYLYNNNGVKVSSSAKAGNEEFIEFTAKKSGVYNVELHAFKGQGTAKIELTK